MAKFELGAVVTTPGAFYALARAGQSAAEFLRQHANGDWGELDALDKAENEHAMSHHGRLVSTYQTSVGGKLWVITESDRSVTTLLLPSEY